MTPPAHPIKPQAIYLCDYGVHSSLLLPVGNRRFVEYMYGDWNWAVLENTSWLDGVGAIFWSQQSCLGRRYINAEPGTDIPRSPVGLKSVTRLIVEADNCCKVVAALDSRWKRNCNSAMPQPPDNWFWYVKDNTHYDWLHNCNRVTADSLTAMGCKLDGSPILSNFRVHAVVK